MQRCNDSKIKVILCEVIALPTCIKTLMFVFNVLIFSDNDKTSGDILLIYDMLDLPLRRNLIVADVLKSN